jgi:hypothetical protein
MNYINWYNLFKLAQMPPPKKHNFKKPNVQPNTPTPSPFGQDYDLLEEYGEPEDKKYFNWMKNKEQKETNKTPTKDPERPEGYHDITVSTFDVRNLINNIVTGTRQNRIRFSYLGKSSFLDINDQDYESLARTYSKVTDKKEESVKPALISRIRYMVLNNIGLANLQKLFPEEEKI